MARKALSSLILCAAVLAEHAWRGISLLLVMASALVIIISALATYASGDLRIPAVATLAIIVNILSQKVFDDSFDGDVANAIKAFGARLFPPSTRA